MKYVISILCIITIWVFHLFIQTSWDIIILKGFALVGCIYACSIFRRNDNLQKIWLSFSFSVTCYLISDLITQNIIRINLIILGNILNIISIYMLAKLLKKSGLGFSLSYTQKQIIQLSIGILIVLIIFPIAIKFLTLKHFNITDYILLISSIGDIISFIFLIPILYTTLSMRGGILMLPWIYISGMMMFWMIWDLLFHWGFSDYTFYSRSGALICMAFAGIEYRRTLPRGN